MRKRLFDPRGWLVWVVAAAATTMLTRNPLYTILLFLISRLVDQFCGDEGEDLRLPLGRLGVVILAFSAAFNAMFVHQGQTVLFRLPAQWPLVGGPITLEATVYGLESGLILLTLISIFLTFNRAVPVAELARLSPRAFQDLGVVVLVALTYIPETMRHVRRIREAQAVRGHRLNGVRQWRPLVVPLLIGSLERAMSLAEAMVARGYGATAGKRQSPAVLATLALGLCLVLGGWVVALWWGTAGWLLLGAGMLLIVLVVWRRGRSVEVTRYGDRGWQKADTMMLVAALLPLGTVVFLRLVGSDSLYYNPYPELSLPPFDPLIGSALLLYLTPAFYKLLQPQPVPQTLAEERYD
jgi:energy-coupling factor transport system permease protein